MARLSASIATIFLCVGAAVPAGAMDLSSTTSLPESHEVLGWYAELSRSPGRLSELSVCLESRADCSALGALSQPDVIEATLGYSFKGGLRLEGEVAQRRDWLSLGEEQLSLDRDVAQQLALMLNASYDFHSESPLTPFIGAGLGAVRTPLEDPALLGEGFDFSNEESSWKLGLQGFAGLQYEFSDDLTVGIRFSQKVLGKSANSQNLDNGDGSSDSVKSRALMLTLTYEFGGP
ncbi:MAG TPA: outer membrane beta-barrel protein [Aestuariivirgaceae bacterium]|jgi:opacity protein-like surface antigen